MPGKAIAAVLVAALIASACGGDSGSRAETSADPAEAGDVGSTTAPPTSPPPTTSTTAPPTSPPPTTSTTAPPTTSAPPAIVVTSSAYAEGEGIPVEFTCDGEGKQPPYSVSGLPSGTMSMAVVMDATVPQGVFTHWVQFDLPPDPEIPEDATELGTLGSGLFGALGYAPPCPLGDALGLYTLQVFAVDAFLDLDEGASKTKLLAELEGRVIGFGELTGEYSRS